MAVCACVCVVRLFRFPASRHYVATFSRFRRAKVAARRTRCRRDEWQRRPTSLHDATTTTADRELEIGPERRPTTAWWGRTTTVGMVMIGSRMGVTIVDCDTAVTCARPATASSGTPTTPSSLISRHVTFTNMPQTIDDPFSRPTSMELQSGRHRREPTTTAGMFLLSPLLHWCV